MAGELVLPVRRRAADGAEAWAEVQRRGYEGLVAKNESAPYRGGPSRSWLKVKVRHEGLFLIGRVGLGEHLRGLLVSELAEGQLVFRGTRRVWGVHGAADGAGGVTAGPAGVAVRGFAPSTWRHMA